MSSVDAFVRARRIRELELRRFNRWFVYLPLGLLLGFPNLFFQIELPYSTYNIVSGSTLPLLALGDYVMSDNSAYIDMEPGRGELAVFKLPSDNKTDFIKRLIGLPGERIQIRKGVLHINGTAVTRDLVVEEDTDQAASAKPVKVYLETLPNGEKYFIWEMSDDDTRDNTQEYLVPPGHYFFLGDNRDSSQDSRALDSVGYVPRANLVGRILYIYWSKNLSRIGTKLN